VFLIFAVVIVILMTFTPQEGQANISGSKLRKLKKLALLGYFLKGKLKPKFGILPIPLPLPIPLNIEKESAPWPAPNPWPAPDPWAALAAGGGGW